LATIPDKEEKKSLEESLAEIDKNTQYINKIVADLQDFAKPLMPKIEETDVEQVVNSALTTLEIPENIATVRYIGKGFPKVKADPTYLKRIIVNLSNNAMQDMPKGGNLP
jgi:nitrogen fixation/metabolism regulation signal transduction histidine kinase